MSSYVIPLFPAAAASPLPTRDAVAAELSRLRDRVDAGLPGKADKVPSAASGNLASLDSSGNLADSGATPASIKAAAVAEVVANAPGTMDTLKEIADILGSAQQSGSVLKRIADLESAAGAGVSVDATLSRAGKAADAKAVGDALAVKRDIGDLELRGMPTDVNGYKFRVNGVLSESYDDFLSSWTAPSGTSPTWEVLWNGTSGQYGFRILNELPKSFTLSESNGYSADVTFGGVTYRIVGVSANSIATTDMIPAVPSAYTLTPAMDGVASAGSATAWARGDHVHPSDTSKQDALSSEQISYINAVPSKAPIASPALTGTPTAPTAATGTNTTQIATTAFVQGAVSGKADKAVPSAAGNLAALNAQGNLADSGAKPSDFATPSDLPYRLVEPGKWEYVPLVQLTSFAVTSSPEYDSGFWTASYYSVEYGTETLQVEGDADALSIDFAAFLATRPSLPGHLCDRAVNAVSVTGATTLTLPALVNAGKSRDLLVRLTVSADAAVTFSAPTGEMITWDDAGSPTATYEAGTYLFRFTEVSQGVFHFADLGSGGSVDPSVLAAKLDSISAAPAFDATKTYSVGEYVTYEGVLYECSTAVTTAGSWTGSTNWTARDMTSPDATLDLMADGRLRLVSADGEVLWVQGYGLASASAATLSCDRVNYYAFASGTTSATFTMPTAPVGKVGDFVLDIDNSANASDSATATLTGAGTAFDIYTANGENISTDVLTFAGGEQCELYFTMTAFGTAAKPAWKVVKQVVEKQEFGS